MDIKEDQLGVRVKVFVVDLPLPANLALLQR
jgi:hypothetical protein